MIAIQYGEKAGERFERPGTRIQIDNNLNDLVGCFLDDSSMLIDPLIAARNYVSRDRMLPHARAENDLWCRAWDL